MNPTNPTNPTNQICKTIQEALANRKDIKIATVFGSASRGMLGPESDIDIAVAAEKPLELEEKIALHHLLARKLAREVDLIDLQAVSGVILQQALCAGHFVRKDSSLMAFLLKKMWYNQEDMMPLTRMILSQRAYRFAYE